MPYQDYHAAPKDADGCNGRVPAGAACIEVVRVPGAVTPTLRLIKDDQVIGMERSDVMRSGTRGRLGREWSQLAGVSPEEMSQALLQAADVALRPPEPKNDDGDDKTTEPLAASKRELESMPAELRAEAEAMLSDPNLVQRILDDMKAVGIAGEKQLAMTLYLIGTSRLLDAPLAAIVQGPSASGKSHVAEAVASLFPPETVLMATSLTENALYYLPPGALVHRLVVGGERKRKQNDATADTTRALREMLSSKRLTKAIPVKRPDGRMETVVVDQPGPISYIESTSSGEIFDEDLNRTLLLATDERAEQSRRILGFLGERYAEATPSRDQSVVERHHALQRMLDPIPIKVPYAPQLLERFDCSRIEVRRMAPHALNLVRACCLLHQRQRRVSGDALVANADDYALARRLLAGPMRRQLGGGAGEAALRFLGRLLDWFGPNGQFTIPEARARETCAVSSVYAWTAELRDSGLVTVLEAAKGNQAAQYRLPGGVPDEDDRQNPLPAPEDVFSGTGR